MAGLAPLGASPAAIPQQLTGTGATVPGATTPIYAVPPKPSPAPDAKNFTAFPSSYAGFGANGKAYGTPGVLNGKLSIVTAPPQTPPPLPGGTAVENNPALGLLGAPPTNPIVIQADKQEAQAAEAIAQSADAQAAEQAAARAQLQQVDFQIAAARADNDAAAIARLQPAQAELTGEIQSQTFAGVGSTPPQPFTHPEIPTVFLNIAS